MSKIEWAKNKIQELNAERTACIATVDKNSPVSIKLAMNKKIRGLSFDIRKLKNYLARELEVLHVNQ